jgi:4-amino-4-deoxy-L-arabinose transferase-like glycosyltransferase
MDYSPNTAADGQSSAVLLESEQDESCANQVKAIEDQSIPWRTLGLILLVALTARIAWLITQTNVIENEGAEYARIAQNLRSGAGYVGTMAGPQLLFPPLYPILIAGFSFITRNIEMAARLVSVLAGTLIVIPAFFISWYVHGRRAAVIYAVLISLYPVAIALSASTYSECLYATLLVSALCCGLLWQRYGKRRDSVFAGIFLGLAYLARPEALAYPFVLSTVVLIATVVRRRNWRKTLLQWIWMWICVAALAVPYVAYLWRHTGQFRLEGKSEVNYVLGARLNSGMPTNEATWGLDQKGNPEGPLLIPNRYLGSHPYPKSIAGALHYFVTGARRNFWELRHLTVFPVLFWSLLIAALFAFLPGAMNRERLWNEVLPICFFLFACLPLAIAPVFSVRRLLLPIVPLALLWASKGIDEICRRMHGLLRRVPEQATKPQRIGWIVAAVAGLLLLGCGELARRRFPELLSTKTDTAMKEAGLWLRQYDPGPKRIMDDGTIISFYSGGTWMPMPSAEATLTLKYIEVENPTFVVLELVPWRPNAIELRRVLDQEPRARLLHEFSWQSSGTTRIYQWSP